MEMMERVHAARIGAKKNSAEAVGEGTITRESAVGDDLFRAVGMRNSSSCFYKQVLHRRISGFPTMDGLLPLVDGELDDTRAWRQLMAKHSPEAGHGSFVMPVSPARSPSARERNGGGTGQGQGNSALRSARTTVTSPPKAAHLSSLVASIVSQNHAAKKTSRSTKGTARRAGGGRAETNGRNITRTPRRGEGPAKQSTARRPSTHSGPRKVSAATTNSSGSTSPGSLRFSRRSSSGPIPQVQQVPSEIISRYRRVSTAAPVRAPRTGEGARGSRHYPSVSVQRTLSVGGGAGADPGEGARPVQIPTRPPVRCSPPAAAALVQHTYSPPGSTPPTAAATETPAPGTQRLYEIDSSPDDNSRFRSVLSLAAWHGEVPDAASGRGEAAEKHIVGFATGLGIRSTSKDASSRGREVDRTRSKRGDEEAGLNGGELTPMLSVPFDDDEALCVERRHVRASERARRALDGMGIGITSSQWSSAGAAMSSEATTDANFAPLTRVPETETAAALADDESRERQRHVLASVRAREIMMGHSNERTDVDNGRPVSTSQDMARCAPSPVPPLDLIVEQKAAALRDCSRITVEFFSRLLLADPRISLDQAILGFEMAADDTLGDFARNKMRKEEDYRTVYRPMFTAAKALAWEQQGMHHCPCCALNAANQ